MVRAFLGGSFDPVHTGHVAMVDHVLDKGLADFVHVVPAWLSPHKLNTTAEPAQRLAMARLAFGERAQVTVEPVEVQSGRSCFTVDTLAALQAAYPGASWLLVIGGDNVAGFAGWHEARRLQTLARVVVLGRAGADLEQPALSAAGLDPARCRVEADFHAPVSSTAIRSMLASGPDAAALSAAGVPVAVAQYIVAQRLYLPERNGESRVPDPD